MTLVAWTGLQILDPPCCFYCPITSLPTRLITCVLAEVLTSTQSSPQEVFNEQRRTPQRVINGDRERERFTSSPTFLCENTPATLG